MAFDRTVAILCLVVGIASLGYAIYTDKIPEIFGRKDRFHCQLMPDTQRGGEVWTVMYRKYKNQTKPWLKMVTTLGGNWTPEERCQEIARRLDLYRQDGLIELTYRDDFNTPNQAVIWAKTKKSGDNCPLIITLKPGANAYETLREMTTALIGDEGIYQSSDGSTTYSFSPESPEIYIRNFLAEDDM